MIEELNWRENVNWLKESFFIVSLSLYRASVVVNPGGRVFPESDVALDLSKV